MTVCPQVRGNAQVYSGTNRGPAADESNRLKFLSETTGSRFLFNKDISEYLTQIYDKAVDLQTFEKESDPTKAKEHGELKKWFIAELKSLEDRFAKFF